MKNETFYKALQELTNNFTSNQINFEKLTVLKNDLEIEIAAEANKENTTAARIKTIKKYFAKVAEKHKIFKYATNQLKGFKTVTDSFMMVSLSEHDAAGLGFDVAEENPSAGTYPDIKKIVNNYNISNCEYNFNIKVNDLKNKMKLVKSIKNNDYDAAIILENEKGEKIGLGKNILNIFLNLMNFKNNDIINFYGVGKYRPLIAFNKTTGSKGLILPVRID